MGGLSDCPLAKHHNQPVEDKALLIKTFILKGAAKNNLISRDSSLLQATALHMQSWFQWKRTIRDGKKRSSMTFKTKDLSLSHRNGNITEHIQ